MDFSLFINGLDRAFTYDYKEIAGADIAFIVAGVVNSSTLCFDVVAMIAMFLCSHQILLQPNKANKLSEFNPSSSLSTGIGGVLLYVTQAHG